MTHETFTPAQSEGLQRHQPIVYLVDDDPSFLRALSRRLQAADYRVETFASAEEFLKCNRSEAAGCMVLELQIPGLGGLALQKLLAQAEDPLPVIFLTAHGDVSSSVRAMKQGAVDFLIKDRHALVRRPRAHGVDGIRTGSESSKPAQTSLGLLHA